VQCDVDEPGVMVVGTVSNVRLAATICRRLHRHRSSRSEPCL
jgi:hypothetical protein